MKITSCLLMKTDARSRRKAEEALHLGFPDAEVIAVESLDEALKRPESAGLEMLVLVSPDKATYTRATTTFDACGLPRWAVIVAGMPPSTDCRHTVSFEKWDEERIVQMLQCGVANHELMRENGRLRGDLLTIASRISHDLRTPLGAIINAGDMLREIASEADPANGALAGPLFDSVDDLGKLIGRVSQLTRASSTSVAKQRIATQEVIWTVLQRHERDVSNRRAVLVQAEAWPEVDAVASWLEAIWSNLVGNCLKHGKEGVRIELGWNRQEHEFRFWVNDNGQGIAPEKVAGLFEPFNLLHRLSARKGLGLSIVRRLVELQGGQCGYSPISFGGSNFYFTVPANGSAGAGSFMSKSKCAPHMAGSDN